MTNKISKENIKISGKNPGKKMDLSIVIPVYNEKDSVAYLYGGLNKTLSKLKIKYEVILIDDGSVAMRTRGSPYIKTIIHFS